MVIVVGSVVAGLTATIGIPVVALHEVLTKRHRKQMSRHLPTTKKRVNFPCEPSLSARAAATARAQAMEEKLAELEREDVVETIALPPPPYKSIIKASPPPYNDVCASSSSSSSSSSEGEEEEDIDADINEESSELKVMAAAVRPSVRFAHRA